LAGDVLFFAVEVVFLPLAVPEVFLETAVFLPAAPRELLLLLLPPAEVLFFGIVVSLLTSYHSISVFLFIW
jgi:hypothetical protein